MSKSSKALSVPKVANTRRLSGDNPEAAGHLIKQLNDMHNKYAELESRFDILETENERLDQENADLREQITQASINTDSELHVDDDRGTLTYNGTQYFTWSSLNESLESIHDDIKLLKQYVQPLTQTSAAPTEQRRVSNKHAAPKSIAPIQTISTPVAKSTPQPQVITTRQLIKPSPFLTNLITNTDEINKDNASQLIDEIKSYCIDTGLGNIECSKYYHMMYDACQLYKNKLWAKQVVPFIEKHYKEVFNDDDIRIKWANVFRSKQKGQAYTTDVFWFSECKSAVIECIQRGYCNHVDLAGDDSDAEQANGTDKENSDAEQVHGTHKGDSDVEQVHGTAKGDSDAEQVHGTDNENSDEEDEVDIFNPKLPKHNVYDISMKFKKATNTSSGKYEVHIRCPEDCQQYLISKNRLIQVDVTGDTHKSVYVMEVERGKYEGELKRIRVLCAKPIPSDWVVGSTTYTPYNVENGGNFVGVLKVNPPQPYRKPAPVNYTDESNDDTASSKSPVQSPKKSSKKSPKKSKSVVLPPAKTAAQEFSEVAGEPKTAATYAKLGKRSGSTLSVKQTPKKKTKTGLDFGDEVTTAELARTVASLKTPPSKAKKNLKLDSTDEDED